MANNGEALEAFRRMRDEAIQRVENRAFEVIFERPEAAKPAPPAEPVEPLKIPEEEITVDEKGLKVTIRLEDKAVQFDYYGNILKQSDGIPKVMTERLGKRVGKLLGHVSARTEWAAKIEEAEAEIEDSKKALKWVTSLKEMAHEARDVGTIPGIERMKTAADGCIELLLNGFEAEFNMDPRGKANEPPPAQKTWIKVQLFGTLRCGYEHVLAKEDFMIRSKEYGDLRGLPHIHEKTKVMCLAEGEVMYQGAMQRLRLRDALLGVISQMRKLGNAGHQCNVVWIKKEVQCPGCRMHKPRKDFSLMGYCNACVTPCASCKEDLVKAGRGYLVIDGEHLHKACTVQCRNCGERGKYQNAAERAILDDAFLCGKCEKLELKCGHCKKPLKGWAVYIGYDPVLERRLHYECYRKIACRCQLPKGLNDECPGCKGNCLVCEKRFVEMDNRIPSVDYRAPDGLRAHDACTKQCPCGYYLRKDVKHASCWRCTPEEWKVEINRLKPLW